MPAFLHDEDTSHQTRSTVPRRYNSPDRHSHHEVQTSDYADSRLHYHRPLERSLQLSHLRQESGMQLRSASVPTVRSAYRIASYYRQRATGHSGIAASPRQVTPQMTDLVSESTAKPGDMASTALSVSAASASPAKLDTKAEGHRKGPMLRSLPALRDHTSDLPNAAEDEYVLLDSDEAGETKIDGNGYLKGGRQYNIRTFTLPGRAEKLFMLATECARTLQYRDSYLLFNKNLSLFKIIARLEEKEDLVAKDILPYSYRSRQIALVTARSIFRQFGSRVIKDGRRVRDDYWEANARKQGFTEEDAADEKRPGAAKAREDALETARAAARQLTAASSNTPLGFDAFDGHRDKQLSQQRLVTGSNYGVMHRLSTDVGTASSISVSNQYHPNLIDGYWRTPHDSGSPRLKTKTLNHGPLPFQNPSTGFLQTSIDGVETWDENQSLEVGSPATDQNTEPSIAFSHLMAVTHSSYMNKRQISGDTGTSSSPLPDLATFENSEQNSLLLAVYSFYASCRQAIEFTVGASGQLLVFGSGSSDTFVRPQGASTSSTNNSGGPSSKRKADDIGDQDVQDSNDYNISTARKRGKRKEITMTEFPCWWFVNDPVRHHACRNYCSRKRDLHSYRRHHFEDHWRWGDVAADGISFEKWNAAKHATCDRTGLTEDERAHRKWKRSYQIYFGLREADPIPQPICPDIGHVHYRPKRPVTHELPTSRQHSSSDLEPRPSEGQEAPTIANSLNEFSSDISFLEDPAHPPSIPRLFPEIDPEGYGDPFQPGYFASWNDRFHIASDLIHTASSIETPKIVVNDYVTRIREILESMYNNPHRISRASIATVLSLVQDFELDFMQAAIDNNHFNRCANSTALSNPPDHLLSDSQTQIGINTMPITAGAGASSSVNVPQQNLENYSDGQTSGSEFLNAPETPSAEDDTYVWVNSSHADMRAATEVSKPDAPPKSRISIPGQDLNIYW